MRGFFLGVFINERNEWLDRAKCRNYSEQELQDTLDGLDAVKRRALKLVNSKNWIPPLFNIEKWWTSSTLAVLSALRRALVVSYDEPVVGDNPLPWVAFCRLVIETSSADFSHVSMSRKAECDDFDAEYILGLYAVILREIVMSCGDTFLCESHVILRDAKQLNDGNMSFDTIITSPPYPNRMSYIRELRPYMYWLKFLADGKQAGNLDWDTIGGTWGCATSNLSLWTPMNSDLPKSLIKVVGDIEKTGKPNSKVLSKYILKYFHDMRLHFEGVKQCAQKKIDIHYIIGNSSFYGKMVDTPGLFIDILTSLGFDDCLSKVIRKRNCNKSLYEYEVSATYTPKD